MASHPRRPFPPGTSAPASRRIERPSGNRQERPGRHQHPDDDMPRPVRPHPATCPVDTAQVTKRMKPGQPGTLTLLRRYGPALVCVRYRESDTGHTRFTTIELVIDQRPARHQPLVRVTIRYDDATTRRQAIALGAQWDEAQKTWRMPRRAAIQLGLLSNRRKAAK